MDEFLTSKEVSDFLKTPIAYIRKMIKEEQLIAYKVGRQYIVKKSDLEKYLEEVRKKWQIRK